MAAPTATRTLAEVPRPDDIENEVLATYELRRKLTDAIEEQEDKRDAAELELARSFARETQAAATIDVEAAFQKNEAWRVADERAGQRIAALKSISARLDALIDANKADNTRAVAAALNKRLDTITKALAEKTDAATSLKDEKTKIEAEIAALPKYTGSTAPDPTTTTPPDPKKK